MKKILYLLTLALMFTACSSDDPDTITVKPEPGKPTKPLPESEWKGDWNDPKDANYHPEYGESYNPLFGKWILTSLNGKAATEFLVYDFTAARQWEYAETKPAQGKEPEYKTLDYSFKINDTAIRNSKGVIFKYGVAGDRKSMTLFDGSSSMMFAEYDNNSVWYWKGDWNNPKDAGYRPEYGGQYNPIRGTWKLISVGGHNVSPSYYRFNDDFTMEELYSSNSKRKYKINDIGLKDENYGIHKGYYRQYKIVGNTLYYNIEPYSEYDAMILTRYAY